MRRSVTATFLAIMALAITPALAAAPLTVMSYNVKGLPWPLALGRPAALGAIASQLQTMRQRGQEPQIVALQEAFVPDAKAIGRLAGYSYESFGLDAGQPTEPATAQDRAYAAAGRFLKGERTGKRVGSGLAIFSEYPIVAVHRIAFGPCAGFDCLANKGALAVTVAVPGVGPMTIIDTHLNSNKASGVAPSRSIYAYRRQIDTLLDFIAKVEPQKSPLLVVGDFNVGHNADRRAYFSAKMLAADTALSAVEQSCSVPQQCTLDNADGVKESLGRNRDWLLFRSSASLAIKPLSFSAPFGRNARGSMLSDHVGISATYQVVADNRTVPALALANR